MATLIDVDVDVDELFLGVMYLMYVFEFIMTPSTYLMEYMLL